MPKPCQPKSSGTGGSPPAKTNTGSGSRPAGSKYLTPNSAPPNKKHIRGR